MYIKNSNNKSSESAARIILMIYFRYYAITFDIINLNYNQQLKGWPGTIKSVIENGTPLLPRDPISNLSNCRSSTVACGEIENSKFHCNNFRRTKNKYTHRSVNTAVPENPL